MKIREYIQAGVARLRSHGLQCADPNLHMKQIVQFVMGWDSVQLLLQLEEPITQEIQEKVEAFLNRRLQGEPFQYIAGEEWFWNSRFKVGPGVLIPRRETEFVVEFLLGLEAKSAKSVVELGAGSGNIGISVLQERPQWSWVGVEANPKSLPFLRENCDRLLPHGHHYEIVENDFFQALPKENWKVDILVSNPPYVPREELAGLAKEVQHEPTLALDGGSSGTQILKRLIVGANELLNSKGYFVTEIDPRQKTAVTGWLQEQGFTEIRVQSDYSGHDRVVSGKRG